MSGDPGYGRWKIEERALDSALTNVAQEALHAVNRGGTPSVAVIEGTDPPQFVAIGTLLGIAEAVASRLQASVVTR
jgi:hypothetical protein